MKMSLGTGKIRLDELPDERTLRRYRGGQLPVSVQTSNGRETGRRFVPPGAAAAAARGASVLQGRRSGANDDSDEDEEEDAFDEEEEQDARMKLQQMRMSNNGSNMDSNFGTSPFGHEASTNKARLVFVAGFRDLNGSVSKNAAAVNLRFSDILRAADNQSIREKLNAFDPTRTVPISLKVLGTSLGDMARHVALEVYDNAGKSLFSKYVQKHNSSDSSIVSGYPLFLLSGKNNTILYNPPALTQDHKSYWAFDVATLEKGTANYTNPSSGECFKIIKKKSKAALLMDYALSVKNRIIVPRLLENSQYFSMEDPDCLRLPFELYNRTVAAYKKKLSEIQASSYDLSSIKIVLKPLELSKDLNLIDLSSFSGHIAFELLAHIPKRCDLENDDEAEAAVDGYMRTVAVRDGDDSSEEEDEEI